MVVRTAIGSPVGGGVGIRRGCWTVGRVGRADGSARRGRWRRERSTGAGVRGAGARIPDVGAEAGIGHVAGDVSRRGAAHRWTAGGPSESGAGVASSSGAGDGKAAGVEPAWRGCDGANKIATVGARLRRRRRRWHGPRSTSANRAGEPPPSAPGSLASRKASAQQQRRQTSVGTGTQQQRDLGAGSQLRA